MSCGVIRINCDHKRMMRDPFLALNHAQKAVAEVVRGNVTHVWGRQRLIVAVHYLSEFLRLEKRCRYVHTFQRGPLKEAENLVTFYHKRREAIKRDIYDEDPQEQESERYREIETRMKRIMTVLIDLNWELGYDLADYEPPRYVS